MGLSLLTCQRGKFEVLLIDGDGSMLCVSYSECQIKLILKPIIIVGQASCSSLNFWSWVSKHCFHPHFLSGGELRQRTNAAGSKNYPASAFPAEGCCSKPLFWKCWVWCCCFWKGTLMWLLCQHLFKYSLEPSWGWLCVPVVCSVLRRTHCPHPFTALHKQDTGRAQPVWNLGLCRLGVLPRALWKVLECSLINPKESWCPLSARNKQYVLKFGVVQEWLCSVSCSSPPIRLVLYGNINEFEGIPYFFRCLEDYVAAEIGDL